MTAKTASILDDPHPNLHIMYPCSDEERIAEVVSAFATAGLTKGESSVLITTRRHGHAIDRRLRLEGLDVTRLKNEGQLVIVDAETMLCKLVVDAVPDAALFKNVIGTLIDTARLNAPSGRVRVFGEMVSLMWNTNLPATVRMEELWNEVVDAYSVPLLCTYSLDPNNQATVPESLRRAHSHTLAG